MTRNSLLAPSRHILHLLVCALVLTPLGISQMTGSALDSTRLRLELLQGCLGVGNADLRQLSEGLLGGYGSSYGGDYATRADVFPPPIPYLESLDRDVKACSLASKVKDKERRKQILSAVREDIAIKAEDCRKFGMGRMVSVRVFTLRGPKTESGWEVFYKWYCSSDFQPDEMRAPQLTSPAIVQLPPGSYSIRAQKKISDTQFLNTGPSRVVVGLQPTVDIQLPIQ